MSSSHRQLSMLKLLSFAYVALSVSSTAPNARELLSERPYTLIENEFVEFTRDETEHKMYGFVVSVDGEHVVVQDRDSTNKYRVHQSLINKVDGSDETLKQFVDEAYDLTKAGASIEVLHAQKTFQHAKDSFATNGHCKITKNNTLEELQDLFEQMVDEYAETKATIFDFAFADDTHEDCLVETPKIDEFVTKIAAELGFWAVDDGILSFTRDLQNVSLDLHMPDECQPFMTRKSFSSKYIHVDHRLDGKFTNAWVADFDAREQKSHGIESKVLLLIGMQSAERHWWGDKQMDDEEKHEYYFEYGMSINNYFMDRTPTDKINGTKITVYSSATIGIVFLAGRVVPHVGYSVVCPQNRTRERLRLDRFTTQPPRSFEKRIYARQRSPSHHFRDSPESDPYKGCVALRRLV